MNNQLKPSAFVGYTNFDLTINLDNNENINDRITVDNIFRNLGGMAANTACFSSFLGNNSFIFSSIGKDGISNLILEEFEKYSVDTSYLIQTKRGSTNICIILVDLQGERKIISEPFSFQYNKLLSFVEKNSDINIIHFDGYRLIDCDTIINIKNQFKFKMSIDLDGAELTNDNIQKLKYFDYIFMNKRTLTGLTSEKKVEYALNKLNFLNDKHIIVTLSDKGAIYFFNKESKFAQSKKFNTIDSTGAGDAFAGSFLYGLSLGLPVYENLEKSCLVAGQSTTFNGSTKFLYKIKNPFS